MRNLYIIVFDSCGVRSIYDFLLTQILDQTTLYNLNVISCPDDDALFSSSLLKQVDFCHTAFGKRLLRQWLCSPSCNPKVIEERQLAIEDLIQSPELTKFMSSCLKAIPDLERLLQKFHSLGLKHRSVDHPDGRAVFFERTAYNKRKIVDFLQMTNSFSKLRSVVQFVADKGITFKSQMLRSSLTCSARDENGRFPDIEEDLHYFRTSFDYDSVRNEGMVIPNEGVHKEYDSAEKHLDDVKLTLENYIDEIRKSLKCSAINYVKSGRNRYQLEIPDGSCQHLGYEFELKTQRKGYKRYSTARLNELLKQLLSAEDRRNDALKDIQRHLFSTFSARGDKWLAVVECASLWDVLFSLAKYSTSSCCMCFPSVIPSDSRSPFISISSGVHPCFVNTRTLATQFIPNDTEIGDVKNCQKSPMVLLLTGANMGGKTTLMRQVALIVILAQIGCKVPASSCLMTPVDRIFTRIGASDNILHGQSTFFVELSETNSILKNATVNSLVIIDELGRGTSTHDGTAIAFAVLKELANNVCCRTIFSTHYHSVVKDFSDHPNVFVGHMVGIRFFLFVNSACVVEKELDDPVSENVTFLYKLAKGACPKSYGFNAAKLAGIRPNVLRNAYAKSQQFANYHHFMLSLRQLAAIQDTLTDEELMNRLVQILRHGE
ncbi:unnamed protein product [Soboliphyme baturini]|uniref:DNA_MISMATCH_REPAIR_2 domain-containing protein n=1 Tax=Soboliphyme baturini TaxID=241478 RepID=A0A183ITS6_9BILA|nr:unnamed protein product [Soboliphyme baturini]